MPRTDHARVRADLFEHLLGLMADTKSLVLRLAGDDGVAPSHLHALLLLPLTDPCSQRDLAGRMRVDASNVAEIIDRLEGRGLVKRIVDANDRRIRRIIVTREGEKLRAKLFERSLSESPLNRLSADEQRDLLDLLAKIVDPIELPSDLGAPRGQRGSLASVAGAR